jgi:hypothetical protein
VKPREVTELDKLIRLDMYLRGEPERYERADLSHELKPSADYLREFLSQKKKINKKEEGK